MIESLRYSEKWFIERSGEKVKYRRYGRREGVVKVDGVTFPQSFHVSVRGSYRAMSDV